MTKKLSRNRLALILTGSVLIIIGIVGLIFSVLNHQKFPLDTDQFGSAEFIDINKEEYNQLITDQKSFLVFVDQTGCITAEGLKKIATEISQEKNVKIYHIMFAEARETSLHDSVKYYPSFIIVNHGSVVSWLKADADEDVERYKNKDALEIWLNQYISW